MWGISCSFHIFFFLCFFAIAAAVLFTRSEWHAISILLQIPCISQEPALASYTAGWVDRRKCLRNVCNVYIYDIHSMVWNGIIEIWLSSLGRTICCCAQCSFILWALSFTLNSECAPVIGFRLSGWFFLPATTIVVRKWCWWRSAATVWQVCINHPPIHAFLLLHNWEMCKWTWSSGQRPRDLGIFPRSSQLGPGIIIIRVF